MNKLFSGRLDRKNYILGTLCIWPIIYLMLVPIVAIIGNTKASELFLYPLVIFFIFFHSVLLAKRSHDVGKSGWYGVFGIAIPIISIFVAIKMIFGKSEPNKNKYGPVPDGKINFYKFRSII